MKKTISLATGILALALTSTFGQPTPTAAPVPPQPPNALFQQRLHQLIDQASPQPEQPPALSKFNLDFPGGTPKDLVAAIEKAMGKPLNAIIPKEDADLQMPPLKMNDVVVPQLFAALKAASRKTVTVSTGIGQSYSQYTGDYGFETGDRPSDDSIWYFHANKPLVPPGDPLLKVCQFYSLDEYLNRGFTVDDITTAIQTGWKMAGGTSLPELSYHKETKLLIAYGEPDKLKTIREVLETLPATKVYLGDVQDLRAKVYLLQKQVDDLKQKASPPAAGPSLEEKSGK